MWGNTLSQDKSRIEQLVQELKLDLKIEEKHRSKKKLK
jgi:hypothetical protein